MYFEIVGPISEVENIAVSGSIHDLARLRSRYGPGRWRKLKGIAPVLFPDGKVYDAAVHWYEAHGIGRKEIKIARILR